MITGNNQNELKINNLSFRIASRLSGGFVKFGDFVKAAAGREFVRIEEQEDRPPIVKPVYSTPEMREWYENNMMKFFGKGAKVPQPRFIQRSIQFLYKYDVSYTKLESYLENNKIQKVYDSILEANSVSFIPPYERVILFILLGTEYNVKDSLEIVNREMAPLGYELKSPS